MLTWRRCNGVVLLMGAALAAAKSASAFDTGPHFDMTRDALSEEGFGELAIQYVQVTNWLTDIHERHNADKIPQSGHTNFVVNILINNMLVTVHGQTATARLVFTETITEKQGDAPKILTQGREFDNLVKRGGKWLIAKRQIMGANGMPDGWQE